MSGTYASALPGSSLIDSLLATLGLFQDAIMQKSVDGKMTEAHIFEYSTALSMNAKPQLIQPQAGDPNSLIPVQMIFVLKVCRTLVGYLVC